VRQNNAVASARASALLKTKMTSQLVEGEDFYREGAALVFTAGYHLRRGYCCESRCRHCPYRKAANIMDDSENSCVATVEARHGE
jgi:hypothetical protein